MQAKLTPLETVRDRLLLAAGLFPLSNFPAFPSGKELEGMRKLFGAAPDFGAFVVDGQGAAALEVPATVQRQGLGGE